MFSEPIFYFIVFLVGLSFGSFLNVLVYRLPNDMNIANPPSACPKCNNELKWFHNIPILSWIFLRGKCGFCKEPISIIYPSLELGIGLFSIALYYVGVTYLEQTYLQFSAVFLMFYLYIAMSVIDYKTHLVHDMLNYPALLASLFVGSDILNSMFIGFCVGLFLFVFTWVYGKIRGFQVMGEGDIPILAGMAALLGLEGFVPALLIGSLLGIILYLVKKENELPYIPLLAGGTFFVYFIQAIYGVDIFYSFLK